MSQGSENRGSLICERCALREYPQVLRYEGFGCLHMKRLGAIPLNLACELDSRTHVQYPPFRKNPHAHKNEIGLPPLPLPKLYPRNSSPPPPKIRNFMGMGVFQQKEPKMPGAHKTSSPGSTSGKITDMRPFLTILLSRGMGLGEQGYWSLKASSVETFRGATGTLPPGPTPPAPTRPNPLCPDPDLDPIST